MSGMVVKRCDTVLKIVFVALFSSGLFMRCANQMSPQGGPKDSLPPMIKAMTPKMGARNMTEKHIFIEFDEYIQLKDQGKEFYTSPFMKSKPSLAIKGRGVRVIIKDTLAQNQSYALNFGSSVRDNNEGNILYGLRYVFSTGSSIDSMVVTGYASDAMKGDSISKAFVFFFDAKMDTIPQYDSILLKHLPDAVGRAENNGIFIAQNLKPIPYKVYAVEDKNGNQRYDPGVDRVGFLDSVCNPVDLGAFAVWLDEYRKYPTADPQLYFRMFTDKQFRRHSLTSTERPSRHQALLRFSAPHPQIDTLNFEGIPNDKIVWEYLTAGKDTISLWFNVPSESLPDTIKGRISYMRHDSINNLVPHGQQLRLAWRHIESREEKREREKEEKERERAEQAGEEYVAPVKPNPFKLKVDAGSEINPQKNIPILFELPLAELDSARITVSILKSSDSAEPIAFSIERDTMNIRKWTISANWNADAKYRLMVPAGAFVDMAGDRNDTLRSEFGIIQKSKYATIVANVNGKTAESRYILEVINKSGKIEQQLPDVTTGKYNIYYVPEGEVRIRVIEDMNGNGKWDSGNLIERRQAERVEFYVNSHRSQFIPTRVNWEVEINLDMNQIFAPISIEKVRYDLQRAEDERVGKWLEEKAKREAEKKKKPGQQEPSGLGIGGALGGAKQQLQSTIKQ